MSDYLMKTLTDHIVRTLPQKKREIYNYVIKMEDEIAEEVTSSGEFMDRLKHDSPHKRAAEHFDLTLFELLQMMKEMEEEIACQLASKMDDVKWIDCTDIIRARSNVKENQKIYFVSLPHS
ncbi:hypothetical protein ACQ4XT_13895 [Halobacillus faecis]